jgi:uncharacterized membrane protein
VARRAALLLTTLAILWVAVILAAPVALAHGYGLLPALVYQVGGVVCHQRPERSFHLLGIQLPVCARCFGLYLSGAAGAVTACAASLTLRPVLTRRASVGLALAALPTAVSVGAEWLDWIHPGGAARAMAALPLGGAAGWLFVRALRTEAAAGRPLEQMRYHS